MIIRTKVIEALERKRGPFSEYMRRQEALAGDAQAALKQFLKRSATEIDQVLAERNVSHAGARPTVELDRAVDLCIPFGVAWNNQQEARAWALTTLTDRPVVSVDGSQIAPGKEYSLPVGALQVGWYINFHSTRGEYIKDVDFEVITPGELDHGNTEQETSSLGLFPDWYLAQQRFVRECGKIADLMAAWNRPGEKPVFLFDGSFVISFAGQMLPERARPYIEAVTNLLDASQTLRMPLVAYVDASFSRDIAALVDIVNGMSPRRGLTDARLLHTRLPAWGDRSPLFWCDRDDPLSREGKAHFYRDVAFAYMRLTANQPPSRVEMPRWMVEEGIADDVLNVVRGEAVVGNGYPWAIETADALSVLRMEDRERFYRFFEEFAASQGIHLERAQKAQSKLVRR